METNAAAPETFRVNDAEPFYEASDSFIDTFIPVYYSDPVIRVEETTTTATTTPEVPDQAEAFIPNFRPAMLPPAGEPPTPAAFLPQTQAATTSIPDPTVLIPEVGTDLLVVNFLPPSTASPPAAAEMITEITMTPPTPRPPRTEPFVVNFLTETTTTTTTSQQAPGNTSDLLKSFIPYNSTNSTEQPSWYVPNFLPTDNATVLPMGGNASLLTGNLTFATRAPFDRRFNGFPAFCASTAPVLCADITVNQCEVCSMSSAGFFVFVVVALALAIVIGNLLVVVIFAKDKSTFTGSYGKIKASLAVADILAGLNLLIVALPHISMTINSTPNDLLRYAISVHGSPLASAGGAFYILIHTSSLYHLVFLSQQRLYAIKWPISYKQQSMTYTYVGLAVVWTIALLCAVSPIWFPDSFTFTYQHLIFLFSLTLTSISFTNDYSPLIGVVVVFFVVPFVLMTVLSCLTGCYVAKHMKKSSKITSASAARKREMMVFATLAAMQVGFTITLVPLIVIVVMSYAGALNSNNIAAPYVICFYISMANSLVNVLVYSLVDKKFRSSVCDLLCVCCPRSIRDRLESTSGTSGHKKTLSTAAMKTKKEYSSKSSVPSHVDAV